MRKQRAHAHPKELSHIDVQTDFMKLVDLPEVMKIEKEAFRAAWPSTLFVRDILADSVFPFVLRTVDNEQEILVGFSICRITYDHLHITNIAVHADYRRQGHGRQLLQAMCELGREKRCSSASLEVRVSNKIAIRLYQAEGFKRTGRIPNYYEDNQEDAFLFVKKL